MPKKTAKSLDQNDKAPDPDLSNPNTARSDASPEPADLPTDAAEGESELATAAQGLLSLVPEALRGLIPSDLSPAKQIAWFNQAKASGAFDMPQVPETDGGAKPSLTPTATDSATLPIHARLAAGYSNRT